MFYDKTYEESWNAFFFSEQKTGVCSVRFSGAENLQRQFYLHQKFYSANFSGNQRD